MAAAGISGQGVRTSYYDLSYSKKGSNTNKTGQNNLFEMKTENTEQKDGTNYPDKRMSEKEWDRFLQKIDQRIDLYKNEVKRETEESIKEYDERIEEEKADAKNCDNDEENEEESELETDSQVIVQADGSKVLYITTKTGNMESTISLKISDASEFVSDKSGENVNCLINSADLTENVE